MVFSPYEGFYLPTYGMAQCDLKCGICENVCPFVPENPMTSDITRDLYGAVPSMKHDPVLGYYLETYAGFSPGHRITSASGGMVTWLLETLLEKGEIDGVICVGPDSTSPSLFRFRQSRTIEDVRSCSGSCYQPVEISKALHELLSCDGRYAVVALPCLSHALRLALGKNVALKSRIRFIIGLVCGQMKSRHFVDYLCQKHANRRNPDRILFRHKRQDRPASDYAYKITWNDGYSLEIGSSEAIDRPWGERWFTLEACDYCDDVFAECADAAFMDAWLPEYTADPRGNNLLIIRDQQLLRIFEQAGHSENISLTPILMQEILASQSGVIKQKRILSALNASSQGGSQQLPKMRSFDRIHSIDNILEAWTKRRIRRFTNYGIESNIPSFDQRIKRLSVPWILWKRSLSFLYRIVKMRFIRLMRSSLKVVH